MEWLWITTPDFANRLVHADAHRRKGQRPRRPSARSERFAHRAHRHGQRRSAARQDRRRRRRLSRRRRQHADPRRSSRRPSGGWSRRRPPRPISAVPATSDSPSCCGRSCSASMPDDERIAGLQTPGGCGALRLGFELIAAANPNARVFFGAPTWPNHPPIIHAVGLEGVEYPYYERGQGAIRFEDMIAALREARARRRRAPARLLPQSDRRRPRRRAVAGGRATSSPSAG